jgi:F-type H+-transporting ATPase subunit epsilon
MVDTFTLEVVTPMRLVVRETVSEAQIPVRGGSIGILPGHTPLLAEIGLGEITYHVGNNVFSCTAIGGFVEVRGDRVIVLADRAERAEEIDVPRAQAALERARKRLATPSDPNVDWQRAEQGLECAQLRLEVAAKARPASVPAGSSSVVRVKN